MDGWTHELRLALTLLLNAGVFAGAYRLARRRGESGAVQAACDAFLLYYVVQYASVALPGVFGLFNLWTMSLVAFAAAAAMWWGGAVREPDAAPADTQPRRWGADEFGLVGCAAFLVAYVVGHLLQQIYNPPSATDSLVYHLPTAVQWIQTGKLGLFPTWYWNPAATYSPATSSTFMAWLMLPAGNDVFARFVQAPALVFLFLVVVRLCRLLRCGYTVSGLIGLAAAVSRPFVSEALFPKDDLFITSFFGAAVLSLVPANLRDRLGPWRVGLAFGMVLASKYTMLLACPLFLFMADAPSRARWRRRDWLVALATGAVLFLPWYVRNLVLTGNPLYPVDVKLFGVTLFEGLFGTERDQQLRTGAGVWQMFSHAYHSLPAVLLVTLLAAWAAALAAAGREALRDPLRRACLLGTPATLVVFVVTSPHHEVRYVYPLLLLLFAVAGMAIARWVRLPWARLAAAARVAAAAVLAGASLVTSFEHWLAPHVAPLLLLAAGAALGAVGALALQVRVLKLNRRLLAGAAVAVLLLAAMPTYVYWSSYVRVHYRKESDGRGQAGISFAWSLQYPAEGPLWSFVREQVPDDATVAIANTYYVYPFHDATFRRRLGYAPVRRGLHDFLHFPRMGDTVPGDLIVQRMTAVMNEDPDKATWLENLRRLGAQYLVIGKLEFEPKPPERRFVAEEPARFEKLFDGPAGAVYRIRQ